MKYFNPLFFNLMSSLDFHYLLNFLVKGYSGTPDGRFAVLFCASINVASMKDDFGPASRAEYLLLTLFS